MHRPTKRFAAMLVAGVAGMAPVLAGCGGEQPSKTTASTPGSTNDASLPASVDFNNREELTKALASIGVESGTYEVERDRASGPDGVAFPTWPSGEIRKPGLKTYRVDVSPSFEGKATLRFSLGKKVLYEAPFDPTTVTTEAALPAAVAEGVKKGDVVTWGVYFADKKQKPATVQFTVTEKPAATKKVSELDANKSLSRLAREVAKAQTLHNYSLLSEALITYAAVGKEDARITSVYAPMMDCLRRLKLKNTPLFEEAKLRAVSDTSPMRGDFRNPGDDLSKAGPVIEAPKVVADGGKKPATDSGKFDPTKGKMKPLPTPAKPAAPGDTTAPAADPMSSARATAAALSNLARESRNRADALQRNATVMSKQAADAAAEATRLATEANDLAQKKQDMEAKAADMSNGLTDGERQNLMEQAAALGPVVQAAQEAAKAAAEKAQQTQAQADALTHKAQQADNEAKQAEKAASDASNAALGLPMQPPTPPNPAVGGTGKDYAQYVDGLRSIVTAAQLGLEAATQRAAQAQGALDTARTAYEAAQAAETATPGTYTPEQMQALQQAVADAEKELGASQQALGTAGESVDAAQKNLDAALNQGANK